MFFILYIMRSTILGVQEDRGMNYPHALTHWRALVGVSNTTLTSTGFTSIPFFVTMNPRNFLTLTSNAHFSGLIFMLYLCMKSNASSKWRGCSKRV